MELILEILEYRNWPMTIACLAGAKAHALLYGLLCALHRLLRRVFGCAGLHVRVIAKMRRSV